MNPPLALMYHAVAPPQRRWDLLERALVVDPRVFAAQMERLARRGYRTLTLGEYEAMLSQGASGRRLLLTFDDAYQGLDEVVTPILRRHGFTAVVFAPTAHLGHPNGWDAGHTALSTLQVMSEAELAALARGPWEVASHGAQHVDLRRLSSLDRRRQLKGSRKLLSELAGRPVLALAYPFGYEDREVREDAARAGYRMAFAASPFARGGTFSLPRRAVTDLDRGALLSLRTAPRPWVYRLEDAARGPLKLRRLPSWWRARGAKEGGA